MAETTGIQWADATFNPWWGCEKVSPGCTHCYAEGDAKRYGHDVWGKDKLRRMMSDSYWRQPLEWNAKAAAERRRWRVFCASHADIGEDREDLDGLRVRLLRLVQLTPDLDWLFLTKRIGTWLQLLERARSLWFEEESEFRGHRPPIRGSLYEWITMWQQGFPPKNVWMGATVEDQKRTSRIEELLAIPAEVRWLSMEPLLEEVRLPETVRDRIIDWVIVGGESGAGARPFNLDWARRIVRHCRATNVKVFVKQLGAAPEAPGELLQITHKKGGLIDEFPEDLRIREFPRRRAS